MINHYDLNMFSDEDIFWAVYRDDYARDTLATEIRTIIPDMDIEDQILFSDIQDNNILITAYKELFETHSAVDLLLDALRENDILDIVLIDHGLR